MGDSDIENIKENKKKKRRAIKIKVPSISIGKKSSSAAGLQSSDKVKKIIKKPGKKEPGSIKVPHVSLEKNESEKDSGKKTAITRIKLPLIGREEEITAVEKDLEGTFKTEKESAEPGYKRNLLKKLSLTHKRGIEEYNFEEHGSLLDIRLEYPYESKQEYWVKSGLAKVVIAHNVKSKLREYLLFEPELTPFEYELLERGLNRQDHAFGRVIITFIAGDGARNRAAAAENAQRTANN